MFRRLAQIEQQLGSRLFERSRAGYALTPCGEEMVRLAERMGEDIVTFERQVTGHDLRPSGELRVTTNDTVLVHLMTGVFAAFRKAYPEIVLDVVVSNQALNLSKRDADVAVRATDRPPDALIGRRAASIAWAVFGASGKAEAFDAEHDARDGRLGRVRREPREPESREVAEGSRRARPRRLSHQHRARTGGSRRRRHRVRAAPLLHRIGDAGARASHRPLPDLANGIWLLTHADLRQTARVRAFMDFAASEIAKQRKTIEGLS